MNDVPQHPSQLILELPHLSASEADDFMIGPSNEVACELVQNWPDWPSPSVMISGPAGTGKTHLALIWQQRANAIRICAGDLVESAVDSVLAAPAVAIEDLDRGIGDETVLFHLLNHARDGQTALLLTSRVEPGAVEIELPDLRSRLRAMPVVRIAPPDDRLLQALLVKLFADRQLRVAPGIIRYLCTHMERSAQSAVEAVAEIDRLALATRRKPSAALAGQALRNLAHEPKNS